MSIRAISFFCAALAAGVGSVAGAAAPLSPPAWMADGFSIADSVWDEIKAERAMCRGEIESGISRGQFTVEELRSFDEWAESLDAPRSSLPPGSRPSSGMLRPSLPEPAPALLIWLDARRTRLITAGARLWIQLAEVAILQVEETWRAAAQRTDVLDSAALLTRCVSPLAREGILSSAEAVKRNRKSMSAVLATQLAVVDAWTVLDPRAPLLLPEPDRDPAAFAVANARWRRMEAEGNLFLRRPLVAALRGERKAQFLAGYAAARDALDDALRRGLSAVECNLRFERLCSFEATEPAPETQRHPSGTPDEPQALAPLGTEVKLDASAEYRPWLALLSAEKGGIPIDRPDEHGRVGLLYAEWRERVLSHPFTPEKQFQTAPGARAKTRLRDALPEKAFLDLLHEIAARPGANVSKSEVDEFIAEWTQMRAGARSDQSADDRRERSAGALSRLFDQPGCATLFALREAAARDVAQEFLSDRSSISAMNAGSGTLIRERVELAVAAEQFDLAEHLLSLGQLTRSLPPSQSATYREAIRALRDTDRDSRTKYLEILSQSDSPALVSIALRRLTVAK